MLIIILSVVGLFRLLLFLFVFYVISRMLTRLFVAFKSTPQSTSSHQDQSKKSEEVTLQFTREGKKIVDKDQGEYVDFEEIK